MDIAIKDIYRDPIDKNPLQLFIKEKDGEEVILGEFKSESGRKYPIINGLPRFVSREFYNSGDIDNPSRTLQTSQSFGEKWNEKIFSEELANPAVIEDLKLQLYSMLNCKSDDEYENLISSAGSCLNAGCGTSWSEEFFNPNKKTLRFGMDLSLSVETAYLRTKAIENVHILQGDILSPPFMDESFDIVFSDGVVHHTPNPKEAVLTLIKLLKPKGVLGLYIYCKKPFLREIADERIRELTTKMSYEDCFEFSRQMTNLGKSLKDIDGEIEIKEDIPLLEIRKGIYPIQKFIYDHFIKCFYSPNKNIDYSHLVNLDWYHPAYASHHTRDEIEGWLREGNMTDWVFTQPPGWEYSGYFIKAVKK